MGELAQDFIDGTCCSECGQYFIHENGNLYTHGYPVLCKDCWTEESELPIAEVDVL